MILNRNYIELNYIVLGYVNPRKLYFDWKVLYMEEKFHFYNDERCSWKMYLSFFVCFFCFFILFLFYFFAIPRQIVRVYLTILWGWRLKD